MPGDWPDEQFDLIVLSEVGYYLDANDLKQLIDARTSRLTADGQLLACHWRPPIDGCPLNARQVHDLLHEHLHLPRLVLHQEAGSSAGSVEPRTALRGGAGGLAMIGILIPAHNEEDLLDALPECRHSRQPARVARR